MAGHGGTNRKADFMPGFDLFVGQDPHQTGEGQSTKDNAYTQPGQPDQRRGVVLLLTKGHRLLCQTRNRGHDDATAGIVRSMGRTCGSSHGIPRWQRPDGSVRCVDVRFPVVAPFCIIYRAHTESFHVLLSWTKVGRHVVVCFGGPRWDCIV